MGNIPYLSIHLSFWYLGYVVPGPPDKLVQTSNGLGPEPRHYNKVSTHLYGFVWPLAQAAM